MLKFLAGAYNEVVHWGNNTFSVLYGNAAKQIVSGLSKLHWAYAECSACSRSNCFEDYHGDVDATPAEAIPLLQVTGSLYMLACGVYVPGLKVT